MRKWNVAVVIFVSMLLIFSQTVFAVSSHLVQKGDTLWLISPGYKTTVNEFVQANNLQNPNYIEAGQRLVIPGRGTLHTVQRGETIYLISRQ